MSVDNGTVQRIVQAAFDAHPAPGDVTDRVTRSWQDVGGRRVPPRCDDYNLVAADHYLFLRYMVNAFSPALVGPLAALIGGYDGLYKGAAEICKSVLGIEIVFRTGPCPASGFSPMVNAWSHLGLREGVLDWVWTSETDSLTCPDNPYPFVPG